MMEPHPCVSNSWFLRSRSGSIQFQFSQLRRWIQMTKLGIYFQWFLNTPKMRSFFWKNWNRIDHNPVGDTRHNYIPRKTFHVKSHQYSLEGWAARNICFPLEYRWFCSLPAAHILGRMKRSQYHLVPSPHHYDCRSSASQDLCRLSPRNLSTHTQLYIPFNVPKWLSIKNRWITDWNSNWINVWIVFKTWHPKQFG